MDTREATKEATKMERNAAADNERMAVDKLYRTADRLRDYPGSYFPALRTAQEALEAWRTKYPLEAAEKKRQADEWQRSETERRQEQYASSFVARNLD